MSDKPKKWVTFVWLGLLLIQFVLPMYTVHGVEETTDESATEVSTTETNESEAIEVQPKNSSMEKTENENSSIDSEESISSEEIQTEMSSSDEDAISDQPEILLPSVEGEEIVSFNGPNLIQNPTFTYNTVSGGRITNWEMIGTTTPVNVLTRNVTLNGMSGDWLRTSDSRFFLDPNGLNQGRFWVSNQNNTGTMIVAQTISTVAGRTYQMSADFSSTNGTVSFTLTAYNGNSVVAGSVGSLNTSAFSLTNSTNSLSWNNRTMQFTAAGTQTTVAYRIAGGAMPQGGIRFPNVAATNRNLTLQASPAAGGTPRANATSITPGTNTTITANPNTGYRFVRWELVSGVGAQIEELTDPETTFTMGSENTVVRAIYEENESGEVHVYHVDLDGQELVESEVLEGPVGEMYQTAPQEIEHYQLTDTPENATGVFGEDMVVVTYVYETTTVTPVDPLYPETEVDPENKPDLPEDQGLLSIDFASTFNFGSQAISAQEETYYAKPQRLLNEHGTVNEDEERPNYVQISDRRPDNERNGWQLAVTQNGEFETQDKEPLLGARLSFTNQALATDQGGILPDLQQTNPLTLVPGVKRVLVIAQGDEGTGTWIYRFGDQETAGESIGLTVPQGANPKAEQYKTSLTWELSAVPGNE